MCTTFFGVGEKEEGVRVESVVCVRRGPLSVAVKGLCSWAAAVHCGWFASEQQTGQSPPHRQRTVSLHF